MIDVKQAVNAAGNHARDLFGDAELNHLRLEEVEPSDDGRRWKITLGWDEPSSPRPGLVLTGGAGRTPRVYKRFEVDAETGDLFSMKMRDELMGYGPY